MPIAPLEDLALRAIAAGDTAAAYNALIDGGYGLTDLTDLYSAVKAAHDAIAIDDEPGEDRNTTQAVADASALLDAALAYPPRGGGVAATVLPDLRRARAARLLDGLLTVVGAVAVAVASRPGGPAPAA